MRIRQFLIGLTFVILVLVVYENQALQCFVCTANLLLKKDCRSLSAARLIDCPDTSDHCNAIVTDIDGEIIVHRGCSGNVEAWGYGQDECDIMTNDKLIDRAVAFYQCRGDGCNNLEPGQITTETKVTDRSNVDIPKFSLTSNLKSQHTVGDENQISGSRAIVTNQEEELMHRRGKQAGNDEESDDEAYGDSPRKKIRSTTTTTTRATTTTEEATTTPTTTTTTTTTTTRRPTTRPVVTRPRRRNFTIFDRK